MSALCRHFLMRALALTLLVAAPQLGSHIGE
jgi:hypothetical protein